MIRPAQILVEAAIDELRAAGAGLRKRGWDCDLVIDHDPRRPEGDEAWTASLTVRLPTFRVPIEVEESREVVV